jgi:hypothetical protein
MKKTDVLTITRQPGSPMRWTIESTNFAHGAPIEDCDYALRYELERAARKAGSRIVYRDAREFRDAA